MAEYLRALVCIDMDSHIAADCITNSWYFSGGAPLDTRDEIADASHGRLADFYEAAAAVYFGNDVDPVLQVRWYDMEDAKPRIPFKEDIITVGLATGNHSYPHEVAIAMSYRAEYVSGAVSARRRGRAFLGPIRNNIHDDQSGNVYVPAATMTAINDAAEALANANDQLSAWSVYSPTQRAATNIDDGYQDVVAGWCDNAFDTIRSRGPKANVRSEWAL